MMNVADTFKKVLERDEVIIRDFLQSGFNKINKQLTALPKKFRLRCVICPF